MSTKATRYDEDFKRTLPIGNITSASEYLTYFLVSYFAGPYFCFLYKTVVFNYCLVRRTVLCIILLIIKTESYTQEYNESHFPIYNLLYESRTYLLRGY